MERRVPAVVCYWQTSARWGSGDALKEAMRSKASSPIRSVHSVDTVTPASWSASGLEPSGQPAQTPSAAGPWQAPMHEQSDDASLRVRQP